MGVSLVKAVGENLAELRQRRRADGLPWTREWLEEACGVTVNTIGRLERGEADDVQLGTLVKLCGALGVDPHRLMRMPTTAIDGLLGAFRESPWFVTSRATDDDMEWLRTLPLTEYCGPEPTPEQLAHLVNARHARAA